MTAESHEASTPDAPTGSLGTAASVRAAGRVSWAIVGILIVLTVVVVAFVYTRSRGRRTRCRG